MLFFYYSLYLFGLATSSYSASELDLNLDTLMSTTFKGTKANKIESVTSGICHIPKVLKEEVYDIDSIISLNRTPKYYQSQIRKDFTGASLRRVSNRVFSANETKKVTYLFLGDSIMLQHHTLFREKKDIDTIYISYHFPLLSPVESLVNFPCINRRFNFTYVNFAALHMLHLYPVRMWELPAILELYYLEDMITSEINKLRVITDEIVLQTPPYVCETRFYSNYSIWFQNQTKQLIQCAKYIQNISSLIMNYRKLSWKSIIGNISNYETAFDFCQNYTMSGNSSEALSQRMKEIAAKNQVMLFDNNRFLKGLKCADSTSPDGRHYSFSALKRNIYEKLAKQLSINIKINVKEKKKNNVTKSNETQKHKVRNKINIVVP